MSLLTHPILFLAFALLEGVMDWIANQTAESERTPQSAMRMPTGSSTFVPSAVFSENTKLRWRTGMETLVEVERVPRARKSTVAAWESRENPNPRLTPREVEVLKLLCEPCATKEIAIRLGISFKTAVFHRNSIMQKVGTHDAISLFRWALRNGYTSE